MMRSTHSASLQVVVVRKIELPFGGSTVGRNEAELEAEAAYGANETPTSLGADSNREGTRLTSYVNSPGTESSSQQC